MIKLNLATAIKLNRTKKDFFMFNLDDDNNIIDFKLSNDLTRYRLIYQHFRVVSTINKKEYITIK